MNNLLFTALLIALLYYFFYYLPSPKKLTANPPLKHNQFTQTEELVSPRITNHEPGAIQFPGPQKVVDSKELDNLKKDIQQKEKTIIGLNNSYNKLETKSKTEIDNLKEQLKDKEAKLKELSEIEKKVDNLVKDIQELNQEIE
jgi:DNA repair exonuclease SbcCD ATPase subunit